MSAEALTQSAQEAIRLADSRPYDMKPLVRETLKLHARTILSLVASIEAAPHEPTCGSRDFPDRPLKCDCWKATAFAAALNLRNQPRKSL